MDSGIVDWANAWRHGVIPRIADRHHHDIQPIPPPMIKSRAFRRDGIEFFQLANQCCVADSWIFADPSQ